MLTLILGWVLAIKPTASTMPYPATATSVAELAPEANPEAVAIALGAMRCAQASGVGAGAHRLALIDYSRPSTEPRLWVFDLATNRLLYQEIVAHGRGSGENLAKVFSNASGSHASSLGLFLTRDTYLGRNGYSLRMEGLEPGTNDHALARALVIHGAAYVNPALARQQGRIGRSHGCPAVRSAIARPLIDALKGGQYVFSYYPDATWLGASPYLKCSGGRAMTAALGAP